ncbi:YoaK family protein [Pseudogulbenkiania subflava]|uniref:Uncharacterized membrane protein YoaK, UPF0700 family n=1 Tax=Pseudogulbenkiania subflava DSM 22618 TaxID=1123014 RepID=A0A1Y6BGV3_9NEIS|nr:YoaK family protein [Pseudogulbenkiania subflava]SMF10402.1 Uncharacterized membrane protein YoaK, UPF0700 family [Pseudogulbenkiania subflava DSM 22618]
MAISSVSKGATSRISWTSVGLGFTAGYVDTLGFVALFGLFTAHVTGNFVLIGSELARPSHGVLIKFLAFPAFVAGIALTRAIVRQQEQRGTSPLPWLYGMQMALLAGFMLMGLYALPLSDSRSTAALVAGMFGAAGMGVQNAASRLALSKLTPTTVMTGNVTQLVIDLLDLTCPTPDPAVRERIVKFLWPILAFAVGAIGGAFGYVNLSFWALLLPIGILAALMFDARGNDPRG